MDVKGGDVRVSHPASPHVGFVRQDQGGGYFVDRDAVALVVVADGGDDGGDFGRVASHVVD